MSTPRLKETNAQGPKYLKFAQFHNKNPHVYEELRDLSVSLVDKGHEKFGFKLVWEVLRYNSMLRTMGDLYKLNNNYCALYARLLMLCEPKLEDVFETRKMDA